MSFNINQMFQTMASTLSNYQKSMWEFYYRNHGGDATLYLWRLQKEMENESDFVYKSQVNVFGTLMIGDRGDLQNHYTALENALGERWKPNYEGIMQDMETDGFEVWVWFDASTVRNALNPFLSLRVHPVENGLWPCAYNMSMFGEYIKNPWHITVSDLSEVLPLQREVEELKAKYLYPRIVKIKPDEFEFSRTGGHIFLTDRSQLYKDVIQLYLYGNHGYKMRRRLDDNPFPPHISL